ncbi:HD domain-containing protein [Desulfothermus okinawensis JCM 13304]
MTVPVLESFPKFRPPINLYYFNEKVNDLQLYAKKGDRLSKEKQEELFTLCKRGNIFVARSDFPIYSKHISKQLDLILQDTNLREPEVAEILWRGIPENLKLFYLQPVKLILENILPNLMVVAQYLKNDPHKVVRLISRVRPSDKLWIQATNVLFVGLGAYLRSYEGEIEDKILYSLVVGLPMVYIGKTKLPPHLINKKNLSRDEEIQYKQYPLIGAKILNNHGIKKKISLQCVLEHCERLDGSGFPQGLSGNDLSLGGRIAAIGSAFNEILCSLKKINSDTIKKIVQYLSQQSEKFDSKLVNGLLTIIVRL